MSTKVILISGASRGFGRAAATALAAAGHRVFGTSRRPTDAEAPPGVILLPLDVRSDDSVHKCVQMVLAQAGRLDVLVNNAGYSLLSALEETPVEAAQQLFDTNFFGVMRLTNAVLPHLRAQRSGLILNVGSLSGRVGVPFMGIYSASKHALVGYSEALLMELRPLGIHVTLLEPGNFRTDIAFERPATRIADYDGPRDRAAAAEERYVRGGAPPDRVAEAIVRIVATPSPPARVTVAHGPERLTPWMRRFLPNALVYRATRWLYRLDE